MDYTFAVQTLSGDIAAIVPFHVRTTNAPNKVLYSDGAISAWCNRHTQLYKHVTIL